MEDIAAKVIEDFYATLEAKLRQAVDLRCDVATATDEWPLQIVFMAPGSALPAGRRWTIYRTSDLDPRLTAADVAQQMRRPESRET